MDMCVLRIGWQHSRTAAGAVTAARLKHTVRAKLLAAIVSTMRSLTQNHLTQLLQGAAPRNLPNLKNLAMELRKICCHPVSGWVLV